MQDENVPNEKVKPLEVSSKGADKEDLKIDIENDEELRKKALRAVIDRYDSVQSSHMKLESDCEKWYQMWKMGDAMIDAETKSDVSASECWELVEDWRAVFMSSIFGVDPPFDVRGKRGDLVSKEKFKNSIRTAPDFNQTLMKIQEKLGETPPEKIEDLLNLAYEKALTDKKNKIKAVLSQNLKDKKFEEEMDKVVGAGALYGTFTAKATFEYNYERVLDYEEVNSEYGLEQFVTEKPKFRTELTEDPAFRYVDLRNLYFREGNMCWVIERIKTTWDKIERSGKGKTYQNLERAKKTFASYDNNRYRSKDDNESVVGSLDRDVDLLEAHNIPLEVKGKRILTTITVANMEEVIEVRKCPYDYPPYIIEPFVSKGEDYTTGIGIAELIEKPFMELIVHKQLSMDANKRGVYCMTAVDGKYIQDRRQLKVRKDGNVELKGTTPGQGVDSIIGFIRPPVEYVSSGAHIIEMLKQEIVNIGRLKSVGSGKKVEPNPTATEYSIMAPEAFKSIEIFLKKVSRNVVAEYLRRAYEMYVAIRQKSYSIEIEGEFKSFPPQDIYTEGLEFEMLGVMHMEQSAVNRTQNMQKVDLAQKIFQNDFLDDDGNRVKPNMYKLTNDVFYSYGDENPDENWVSINPPPPQAPGQMALPGIPGGGMEAPASPGAPMPGEGVPTNVDIAKSAIATGAQPGGV